MSEPANQSPGPQSPRPQSLRRRDDLSFSSVEDVIADVQQLRKGYAQTGAWSLPQICWHLETATRTRMISGPFPPDTPEQAGAKERLPQILSTGKLPNGIQAPAPAVPPPQANDSSIDALIATLKKWDTYTGEI